MYHVLKIVKQMNQSLEVPHICHDSEEYEFEDARTLAELLANTHVNDIMISEKPKEEYEGSFWFFTNNGTKVTYRVQKKWVRK